MSFITVDAILFDMDGTLIDSMSALLKTVQAYGERFGFDDEAAIEASGGSGVLTIREILQKLCNITDNQMLEEEEVRFDEGMIERMVALPGVLKILDTLRAGSTPERPGWTIVTGGPGQLEVPPYISIITADDVRHEKPFAEPYLAGAKTLNVDPKDCLVIEDSPVGVKSGKAAGARVLGVATSDYSALQLHVAGADWTVSDLACLFVRWNDEGRIEVYIA